jgi:hypothetical protein
MSAVTQRLVSSVREEGGKLTTRWERLDRGGDMKGRKKVKLTFLCALSPLYETEKTGN